MVLRSPQLILFWVGGRARLGPCHHEGARPHRPSTTVHGNRVRRMVFGFGRTAMYPIAHLVTLRRSTP